MQRIAEAGGLFIGGNPGTGTKGTVLTAAWANAVQEEIARTIELAGIPLNNGTNEQLRAAITAMISGTVASTTVPGIVELATSAETQSGASALLAVTPAGLTARTGTETRTGIVELATNAEMATGTDTARVPPVSAVMSLFSKRAFSTSDFIRIPDVPGGLLIQWGALAVSGSLFSVTFPQAFPTACFSVVITPTDSQAAATATTHVQSLTTAGFDIDLRIGVAATIYYVAIGR